MAFSRTEEWYCKCFPFYFSNEGLNAIKIQGSHLTRIDGHNNKFRIFSQFSAVPNDHPTSHTKRDAVNLPYTGDILVKHKLQYCLPVTLSIEGKH